jgi:hypothetical protein
MKLQLPFMKFYPADWLLSPEIQSLPAAGRGAVINLWCWLWHHKRLPADDAQLAHHAGCTAIEWATVRELVLRLFKTDGAVVWHEDLDALRQKAVAFHEERSRSGKRGAESTWIGSANGSANGKSEVRSQKLEDRDRRKERVCTEERECEREKQTPSLANASDSHTPSPAGKEQTKPSKRKSRLTQLPEDFGVSDRVRKWAAAYDYSRLEEHLEYFLMRARARGLTYVDWDQAFMTAVRDDWAHLRSQQGGNSSGKGKRDNERFEAVLETMAARHS